jgi:hypothetical protein
VIGAPVGSPFVPTTLKNRTTQSRTYILHAGPHVAELMPVRRQDVAVESFDPETGARSVQTKARRLPESITLLPKGTPGSPDPSVAADLPNSVLHCPDVQRDMRLGFLDVITTQDAEPAKPPTPEGNGNGNTPPTGNTPPVTTENQQSDSAPPASPTNDTSGRKGGRKET